MQKNIGDFMDTFDKIELLLKKHNMSQSDLARATGISTGLISQWKKRMQKPSLDKLKLVASVFDVPVDYFVEETDKKIPASSEAELKGVYFNFAKEAQEIGIDPDDIKLAIETIKKLRGEK